MRQAVVVRIHAAGGGVQQHLHVPPHGGLVVGQRAALAAAADQQNLFGALGPGQGGAGLAGAAGAQDHHHPAPKQDAVPVQQIVHAVVVGVVAGQFPSPVHHRVHRADLRARGSTSSSSGSDRLFIGDGDIERRKLPRGKKRGQLLRRKLNEVIGVVCELLVDQF